MASVGLVVPVYKNFEGFAELMQSVDRPVLPIVIPNWEKNLGVSMGWNLGLRKAIETSCDYALVCNDDIVLAPGTIDKLVEGMEEGGFDLVTAVNGSAQALDYPEAPDFACFMVQPNSFIKRFGYFDTKFSPAYFEDNDMHYRIRLDGGMAVCRTDAAMIHKGSVTQNWDGVPVVTGDMFERNRRYYIEKWGGTPGNESYRTAFNS